MTDDTLTHQHHNLHEENAHLRQLIDEARRAAAARTCYGPDSSLADIIRWLTIAIADWKTAANTSEAERLELLAERDTNLKLLARHGIRTATVGDGILKLLKNQDS